MYMALYRQWRPKTFAEIVGQEHVRQTLMHALAENKVAHAYLFSGPRGTGKTTAARLLAKSLNCANRQGIEPCQDCSSCREIDQGAALDVVEIDAASNRGIDEIRDLREKVRLAAAGGRYKVYIIDEVHMLTTEAFNALLKTLEDPPVSVVFVLATTEAHRVPETILSRVQHFEFRRIAPAAIEERLREVCEALSREVEDEALHIIALKSEGGLRDALSMLDQCLNQEGRLSSQDVLRQLGMMGESGSADLVDGLLKASYADILQQMDKNMALGRDPRQLLRELLEYLREMMIFLAGGSLAPRAKEALQRLEKQAAQAGMARVLAWIHLLLKGEADLKYAPNARLAVEMLLVQAIYAESGERKEQGGRRSEQAESGFAGIANRDSQDRRASQPAVYPAEQAQDVRKKSETLPQESHLAQKVLQDRNQAPDALVQAAAEDKRRDNVQADNPHDGAVSAGQTAPLAPQSAVLTAEMWEEIVKLVNRRSKPVHAFLLAGEPRLAEGKLQIEFAQTYAFHCEMLNQEINKKILAAAAREVMGHEVPVTGIVVTAPPVAAAAPARKDTAAVDAVEKAKEIFGSGVVVVREDGE